MRSGKTEFAISNGSVLHDYPLTGEATITQRLLSTDKDIALAALDELTANVPGKLQPRTDLLIRITYHCLLFIAAFSAVIMLLTKKYRIKRMVKQYIAASGNA